MTILIVNLSRQAVSLDVTYVPSSGGGPLICPVALGPRDLLTNIGTVGLVPNSATSCINIIYHTTSGAVTVLYGQNIPVPAPIGFNFLTGWAASTENVVITITDMEGGMTE